MTTRPGKKRRVSFTVTVFRDADGHKHFVTKCNKKGCPRPNVGSVEGMTRHSNDHFSQADNADWMRRQERDDIRT